jgi:hypothetical protein
MKARLIFGLTILSFITSSPAISSPDHLCVSQPHSLARSSACPKQNFKTRLLRLVNDVDCDAYDDAVNDAFLKYLACETGAVVASTCTPAAACAAFTYCVAQLNQETSALDRQYPGCSMIGPYDAKCDVYYDATLASRRKNVACMAAAVGAAVCPVVAGCSIAVACYAQYKQDVTALDQQYPGCNEPDEDD